MKCKGGCNKDAIYGLWCSNPWFKCIGYKERLSTRAQCRGNNGIRGKASKKYVDDDKIIRDYDYICSECNLKFKRKTSGIKNKKTNGISLCDICIRKKVSISLKKRFGYTIETEYHRKNSLTRKKILWEEQGKKCIKCGFSKDDYIFGPYELHHIDGNCFNKKRENEELLCRNCHWYTDNWGFKNRHHTVESRQLISINSTGEVE